MDKLKVFTMGYADNTMTSYFLDHCVAHGVGIDGVILIRSPWKRSWNRFIHKMRSRGFLASIRRSFENVLVKKKRISELSHSHLANVFSVDEVNSQEVRDILTGNRVDLLILTSTPIIGPILLDIEGLTIINAHTGWLPRYRGLDANIKAMRDGHHLGVSIHKVTKKIDGGEIYLRRKFEIDFHGDILGQMDKRELELSTELLVEAIGLKKNGALVPIAQSEPLGSYEPRLLAKQSRQIVRDIQRAKRR